ncbi:hypothetical protein [Corynebacterium parakroppenstedtii]|uniref:hypothetical protein n=1 Tax=Corynebacterium parakroppenstedtii TaxID=2828363 RepID=UPI001C8E9D0F|nr:hypothetical protein [Corynebacterium parakroppenstedtii]
MPRKLDVSPASRMQNRVGSWLSIPLWLGVPFCCRFLFVDTDISLSFIFGRVEVVLAREIITAWPLSTGDK